MHLRALAFGIITGRLFPLVGVRTNKIWGFNLIVGEDTNDGESCGKVDIGIEVLMAIGIGLTNLSRPSASKA